MNDPWNSNDPIDIFEDVRKTALRYVIVFALLVGSALFCLGYLFGRFG